MARATSLCDEVQRAANPVFISRRKYATMVLMSMVAEEGVRIRKALNRVLWLLRGCVLLLYLCVVQALM